MADVVWSDTFDEFQWKVTVFRTGDHRGLLLLEDEYGTVRHTQEVTLSYDAMFGPDEDDVLHWQELAMWVVDNNQFNK